MSNNQSNTTDMQYPLEQQEDLPSAGVPQDDELRNSTHSESSSSSSTSSRVEMTGEVIPTGSLSRQVSDNLMSAVDDDDDESDLEEEYLVDFPLHDNEEDSSKDQNNKIDPSPSQPRQKKRVSFDSIDIREYSRCLQMHPETARGPPIGLDWEYEQMGTFNFEEFETIKENTSHTRRRRWSFQIPAKVREALLIDSGHTEAEMEAVVKEVKNCRQQRRQSFEAQEYEDWLLMKEACKRRFRRWKTGVSKKREQELLWETAARRLGKGKNETPQMSPASKAA